MVNNWPFFRDRRLKKWHDFILRFQGTLKSQMQTIYANFFPSSMDLVHLRERADFLQILELENDTIASFRARIQYANFWWSSAGTEGQQRQVLNLIMGHGNWRIKKGRIQSFRIGYSRVGDCYVGNIGSYVIYLKDPSESQHRDTEKYVHFAMAPYLQWRIVHYSDDI